MKKEDKIKLIAEIKGRLPKVITPTVEPPPNKLSQNQIFAGGQVNMLLRVKELLETIGYSYSKCCEAPLLLKRTSAGLFCSKCKKEIFGYIISQKPIKQKDNWKKGFKNTKFAKGGGSCFECCDYEGMYLDLEQFISNTLKAQKEEIGNRAKMTFFFIKTHPDCDIEAVEKTFLDNLLK